MFNSLKKIREQRVEIKRLSGILQQYECNYYDHGKNCPECYGTGYVKLSSLRRKIEGLRYSESDSVDLILEFKNRVEELEKELATKNIKVEHSLSEGLLEALRDE